MKLLKYICALILCAGLTSVIVGGGIFYARRSTSYRQRQIEPQRTQRLSAFTEIENRGNIRLCAHRGLSAVAPENSLQAIEKAGEEGFPFVLLNIGITKDSVPVLLFDETIDRMTKGQGRLSFQKYADLQEYPLDNGANVEKYDTLYIPSLSDAWEICRKYGMTPVISVRSERDRQALEETIRENEGPFVLLCDKPSVLLSGRSDRCALWYRVDAVTAEKVQTAKKNGWTILFEAGDESNTESILKAASREVPLGAICVNDRSKIGKFVSCGVKIMVTDSILPILSK